MRKLVFLAIVVAVLACALAPGALAQEKEGEKGGRDRASQRMQERWEKVRQRLELIITRFDNNRERHVRTYERARERVRQLLEQMSSRGLDVSDLSRDLAVWDEMIRRFGADCVALIDKLREISAMSPEEAEKEFVGEIREAREMLRKVYQDAMDIRLFYQKTIRSDIQKLRSQMGGEGLSG